MRIGRHPGFSPGIAVLGKVLKVTGIVLWLLLVLTSVLSLNKARMPREKGEVLIGFAYVTLLIIAPVWGIGWALSRKTLRYRCELCGKSISKKEYLARSTDKHDIMS